MLFKCLAHERQLLNSYEVVREDKDGILPSVCGSQMQESLPSNTFFVFYATEYTILACCTHKELNKFLKVLSLVTCCIKHSKLETVSNKWPNSVLKCFLGERKRQMRFPLPKTKLSWAFLGCTSCLKMERLLRT